MSPQHFESKLCIVRINETARKEKENGFSAIPVIAHLHRAIVRRVYESVAPFREESERTVPVDANVAAEATSAAPAGTKSAGERGTSGD